MPNEREKTVPWQCNNCGHGAANRPERKCNCHCHEVWDAAYSAAIEDAAGKVETLNNNGEPMYGVMWQWDHARMLDRTEYDFWMGHALPMGWQIISVPKEWKDGQR